MTARTPSSPLQLAPARPSWQRLSLLTSLLLIGWALLVPAGRQPRWWHLLLATAVVIAFLGSWHGLHLSTAVARWTPMAWRNHRLRSADTIHPHRRGMSESTDPDRPTRVLEARIIIHLRPHPHTLTTPADHKDQLPWQFIIAWLHRYGVRADELTVCSVTRTPTPSSLRSDAASLLTGHTPQHRDTWLTYTLRADSNVAALTSRQTLIGSADTESEDTSRHIRQASLADTTARRLIAELREQGWLATLCDTPEQQLPQFVPQSATVRREAWTATEYSDGFRAVHTVDPQALSAVLSALPTLATKATWVAVTIGSRGHQPTTISACVATLTVTRPPRQPLPGLNGFHGLHHQVAPTLTATGMHDADHLTERATTELSIDLAKLAWPTTAFGVPLGFNRARQPVYLGLDSPEPVLITVTGTPEFHLGVAARLALSGLPIAVYTAELQRWIRLANHASPQQILLNPPVPAPDSIIINDGGSQPRATGPAPILVTLRRPQPTDPPATTIVITQDRRYPDLFSTTTSHGHQWLSTRLPSRDTASNTASST